MTARKGESTSSPLRPSDADRTARHRSARAQGGLRRVAAYILRCQSGVSVLEIAIAEALLAMVLVVLATALIAAVVNTAKLNDDKTVLTLAKNQLDAIQAASYQPSATASYALLTDLPTGYSISVAVSKPVTYIYASPASTEAPEVLQKVSVTVTGRSRTLTLEAFKVP